MHKVLHTTLKWTGRVVAGLIVIVLLIPVALYIPPIQDAVRGFAVKKVNEATGMNISVDYLRLKFPLRLHVDGVSVVEAGGDTMVTAASVAADVRLFPLLKGDVSISQATLRDAFYRLGTPDSILYLRARIGSVRIEDSSIGLSDNYISIDNGEIDRADISLIMLDSVAPTSTDTTASAPWLIEASRLHISDVTYRMQMLPVIDSLNTRIGSATLRSATVDMAAQRITANCLLIDSVDATYLTPDTEYIASHPAALTDTAAPAESSSQMWTITADSLRLSGGNAIYAMRGATPLPGLDMNYIQASGIEIAVDSFYNRGTDITVPLRRLRASERCGITLTGSGVFAMDSGVMYVRGFDLGTYASHLTADARMGIGDLMVDPTLPLALKADAEIALSDIEMAMPSVTPMLRGVPRNAPLTLVADIEGTSGQLTINTLRADMARIFHFAADGDITEPMNFDKMSGTVVLDGSVASLNFMKPTLLEASLAKEVNLPPMRFGGSVDYSPGLVAGNLRLTTGDGRMAMKGRWNQRAEGYDAKLDLNRFPVNSFMPSLGVGHVTATLEASGRGYALLAPASAMRAKVDLHEVEYMDETYSDVALDAQLEKGKATGYLASLNTNADLWLQFNADITPDSIDWDLMGTIHNLDLMAMKVTADTMRGSMGIQSRGRIWPATMTIHAGADITDLRWQTATMKMNTPLITGTLDTDSLLHATVVNGDLTLAVDALCPLDTMMSRMTALSDTLTTLMDRRNFDMMSIQHALPPMDLRMIAGRNNVATQVLASSGIAFDRASLTFHNDSLMAFTGKVTGILSGTTRVDTIDLSASQHGRFLLYRAHMGNRPGTMNEFAKVNLSGYLANDKLSALIKQYNIDGVTGFSIGMNAALADSTVTVRMIPYNPTIAYKPWTVNKDNFVTYNFVNRHLSANLLAESAASSVHLYTQEVEGDTTGFEQVVLKIDNVELADWLSISPFAPPIKGEVSADMKFLWDEKALTGNGMLNLTDLYYGKERVGTFGIDLDLTTDKSGALRADAALMIDSIKVITAEGALNDSTAREPFLLDFSMIHFPLNVLNPFLPKDMAQLSGTLNGEMDITGNLARPIFNGYIDFDSTAVRVGMLGTSYTFSGDRIPVDSNIVQLTNFTIRGCNDNLLAINGRVDARHLSDVTYSLDMKARDMQIVNSNRPRGADIYGKAFIDLDADVKGNMQFMRVNARLDVLSGTNVTYVVPPTVSGAISSRNTEDMVKFVQFNDTTQMLSADSITTSEMAMMLEANLIVSEGSVINVELPGDNNKAQVQGYGNLTYTMTPMSTDGRLTGRFTINKGFIHYTPPLMGVISELPFDFREGSYIAFNGDMMNPTLNVTAVDQVKANVTQEGQNSRLVNFDVSVAVTNTLSNMNVVFNMEAPDDITVQNELTAMSADQRANAAMNMLLYREYTGPNTSATARLGNPLYSFLESRVNNWLANSVKGVDISLGVNQYDQTTDGVTSTATSYSYRVSKNLLNDRIKIIVGGNYNTEDDDNRNLSQNLINDISIEYLLNRAGSMYIRVFRHTGFESILEGEVTQTGVGFVYQRKLGSLWDIFRLRRNTQVSIVTEQKSTADDEND